MKNVGLAAVLSSSALSMNAFCQNSMTIYGQIDEGVQYESSLAGKDVTRIVSNGRSGSRWGFRGVEDLGDGINAIFQLEGGMSVQNGTAAQGGRLFGRQAFVELSSHLGAIAAGRIATFGSGTGAFDMVSPIDPFSTAWGLASLGSTFSSATGLRTDNAILYQTPEIHGFQAGAMYSFNQNSSVVTPQSSNVSVLASGAKYSNGPFYATVTYEHAHNPSGANGETHLQAGAAYDFRIVKIYGAYDRERNLFSTDLNISGTTNGAGAHAFMIGFSVPIGVTGSVRASYQKRIGDVHDGEKRDIRVASIGYDYALSKSTLLYAVIADEKGGATLAGNASYNKRDYTVGMLKRF
ncbi:MULTISPECIES: porin [Paraburkholderia]|uniref:porin n=1 Tax=Paraburkholderia TaxID=1822464 RepID=UPI002AB5FD9A|nr:MULTISPECIES: porin [Paraburkholderia]